MQGQRAHASGQNGEYVFGSIPGYGKTDVAGVTVPADGVAGYAPGCIFRQTDGGAGTAVYINEGTKTSADFNPIVLTGTNLSGLTATAAELNTLHSQTLATGAGAGITDGVGTVYKNRRQLSGGIYLTTIIIDLTGLASSTTDLDIIGAGTNPAYLAQVLAAESGTILMVAMTCLEAPAGGVTDIDLYSAAEATGKFDDAVAGLTETALITSGGAWTNGATKGATVVPAPNEYLYLTGGAAGTANTYTAGKFLIQLFGY